MLPELKTMPRVPAATLKATHSPCYPIELVVVVLVVPCCQLSVSQFQGQLNAGRQAG